MNAAFNALPEDLPTEVFDLLAADLRQIVFAPPAVAADALGVFVGAAEAGNRWRAAILEDDTCRSLLTALWGNYMLFAVLAEGGAESAHTQVQLRRGLRSRPRGARRAFMLRLRCRRSCGSISRFSTTSLPRSRRARSTAT
jgi:hypothetical protein